MHPFFVPPDCIDGEHVTLAGDVAHQLARVLRTRPGDSIVVLDDSGCEYLVVLKSVTPRQVRGRIAEQLPSKGEPDVRITLFQALIKADKFEFVLQKGTELRISVFVPVLCARSVPEAKGGGWTTRRRQRWRRIICEAAEQSHRGKLPTLEEPVGFSDACDAADGMALIPWEGESRTGLKDALERRGAEWRGDLGKICVFTGPEGGFTKQEIERASASEIVPVSLGRRILRAETAAVAAVAAIMYEFGELGG